MTYTIHPRAEGLFEEPTFELFRHAGLLCCVQRLNWTGWLNGYVAVPPEHPFFGLGYHALVAVENLDELQFNGNWIGLLLSAMRPETELGLVSVDMFLQAHGGITYANDGIPHVASDLFGPLWVFGFDTGHASDLKPYQSEIDRRFPDYGDEYRDFTYVRAQTCTLAEQLARCAFLKLKLQDHDEQNSESPAPDI